MRLEVAQDIVRARCWGRCEGCGAFGPVQVHHRRARGVGGVHRAEAERANDPRNLLALCPPCHAKTEDASTWRQCEELGWRVEHGIRDPYEIPAYLHTVNGVGWWLLTAEGGYRWQDLPADHRITWREDHEDGDQS